MFHFECVLVRVCLCVNVCVFSTHSTAFQHSDDHTLNARVSLICLTAEREEMISCVFISRDEERVAVAFSRPVQVSYSVPICFLLVS